MNQAMDGSSEPLLIFAYHVFEARSEQPTDKEVDEGIYLVGRAEAHHLRQFFEPLYEKVGIGIDTSDETTISGRARLSALREAIDAAIQDAEQGPPEWPVEIGFAKESPSGVLYDPIVINALRSRLLEFLRGVLRRVDHALLTDGYIYFEGGT
jgi:hypothetical protein